MNERDDEIAKLIYGTQATYQEMQFAALIRADERDVWERRVARLQSLMDVRESQPNKPCCLAEREACALICDEHADDPVYCGAAIRARGNT